MNQEIYKNIKSVVFQINKTLKSLHSNIRYKIIPSEDGLVHKIQSNKPNKMDKLFFTVTQELIESLNLILNNCVLHFRIQKIKKVSFKIIEPL